VDLAIDRFHVPSHLGPEDMVRQLSTSIESLDVPTSLQYANAYLHTGVDTKPLMEALALATSKTQDNPHYHKIVCTALEEYELSTSPQKGEFLLMASAYISDARSMRDCYELYTKYFPG
jgi:hypothetical protein